MRKLLFVLPLVVLLGLISNVPALPTTDPLIAAAGDIARPTSPGTPQMQTAALITSANPAAVLGLGDDQYEVGALADYLASYQPTWGAFKAITKPSVGNHQYKTAGAAGFAAYWGLPSPYYYSFDVRTWHVIALNGNCGLVGGCGKTSTGTDSPQLAWLKADLAAHPATCTLAYWHQPRFSSGTAHGSTTLYEGFWKALIAKRADIVLNGHEHNYERFAPQNTWGVASATGLREFVVGTGGRSLYSFGTPVANSQVRIKTYGILFLTLHPTSYDWQFKGVSGAVLDSGSANCVV